MERIFFDRDNTFNSSGSCVLSNEDLTVRTNYISDIGTNIPIEYGRIYWEVNVLNNHDNGFIGIVSEKKGSYKERLLLRFYQSGEYNLNYVEVVANLSESAYLIGDMIGMALDAEKKLVSIYVNGAYKGCIQLKTTEKKLYPAVGNSCSWDLGGITAAANFGETQFMHPIPSGYKSWYQVAHPRHSLYLKEHLAYGMDCLSREK